MSLWLKLKFKWNALKGQVQLQMTVWLNIPFLCSETRYESNLKPTITLWKLISCLLEQMSEKSSQDYTVGSVGVLHLCFLDTGYSLLAVS